VEKDRSMAGIFISYRREDSRGHAGRLYDHLQAHFGEQQVFMDMDSLKPGEDFVDALQSTLAGCDVLIAVIGRDWLTAKDEYGQPRLANPEDLVLLEISTALERGLRVIPVLVGGAQMPQSGALPDALKKLARRHAVSLRDDIGFRLSIGPLIESLDTAIKAAQDQRTLQVEFQAQQPDVNHPVDEEESIQVNAKADSLATGEAGHLQPKKAATDEGADSMFSLGVRYETGDGVEQDYQHALRCFKKAAAAGNVDAMNRVGLLYDNGNGVERDYQQALRWYKKAAAAGNADAMENIGVLHSSGDGVEQDYDQARQWYEKAAMAGSASAMNASASYIMTVTAWSRITRRRSAGTKRLRRPETLLR
jgi:hypothetical protein